MDELREALRKTLFAQREQEAQQEAKDKLVETLVDVHEFPVPEAFIDRQVRNRVEQTLHSLRQKASMPARFSLTGRS